MLPTELILDITASYQLGFLICATMSTIGIMLAVLLKPTSNGGG